VSQKSLLKIVAISAGAAALALVVAFQAALSIAAPPRPPRPRPPRRVVPRRVRRVVVPRRRRLVVRRVGPKLVVRHGKTVVRPARPPVVVRTVTDLRPVPVLPAATIKTSTAYKVVRVDDDAAVVMKDGQKTTVRLLGVESALSADAGAAQKSQAALFYKGLLAGEWVYLSYDDGVAHQDADGNLVAYLHRAPDAMFVNLEAVRQGYALAADGYEHKHKATLEFYEGKAQADHKGLWATKTEVSAVD